MLRSRTDKFEQKFSLCADLAGPAEVDNDWSGRTQGRHAVEIWGEMSRPDDGGTEGPERGAGGAKRRSAEGGRVWEGAP